MKRIIELLAPVGNFKTLHAAVTAGADAVYFGIKSFNMRDSATNFTISELSKVRKYCNSGKKKVKMYLTLNTIIYDNELKKLEEVVKKIKGKVDAVICWDLSVISLCRKYKIPFHISTQASVSNSKAAKHYKDLGAERVVLAREVSLKQIKEISKVIDTEIFGHGAMCVSISGRCFMSQFQHNRSANRGQCTHPCRRSYVVKDMEGNELKLENNKVMSAKDLCTLPFIEKIKSSGIVSLKIEGRMREPEYVFNVISVYRKALDKKLSKKEVDDSLVKLSEVYNRDFSSGFFLGLPTPDDFTNSENSSSTKTKRFVGKVTNYWKKSGVAAVRLNAGTLKVGDEVIITGENTFISTKIPSIEINHKNVPSFSKGEIAGIKLPLCRKNDEVYKVIVR
ncbi:protease [Candidatus Pacearchaeota archaeon CG10_big_fil_rev_8_21_14_0_10_35_13]|nr:MAG: protease [Candidatus Pacearchaeota archaeon CG10_big_fil_rev_8_21_14_0_10_35_13]